MVESFRGEVEGHCAADWVLGVALREYCIMIKCTRRQKCSGQSDYLSMT
jgi:hypothetical protein